MTSPISPTPPLYSPGNLVKARGREWIVLTGSDGETLRLRPISGSEEDVTLVYLPLELEPVEAAQFPLPTAAQVAGHDAALLLRDALLLSLRRGAGPFRSFGQIAVEPRAYQLVPLMMALKLDPVRLLIADDVGVGKTIEAGLIAREMLDRGEVERLAVLCPPHLVDQWVQELEQRFHIRAEPVTAASANRLERDLPPGVSIFTIHPHTVVSLDYIKSEKRRADFLRACPELVIVDEAHTCAATTRGRHQRYELLRGLAEQQVAGGRGRHLILLTATPHSGDDEAFHRLLGLLHPDFAGLSGMDGAGMDGAGMDGAGQAARERLRARLGAHFVQRRRPDIEEWREGRLFPVRETAELTYRLSGPWDRFFTDVLAYCASVMKADAGAGRFYSTLSLMRCASSSPAAAVLALRGKMGEEIGAEEREELLDRLFDGSGEVLSEEDTVPAVGAEGERLQALVEQAERLAGQAGDPKLKALTDHLQRLLADGFNPVVFCRYIATASYLYRALRARFEDAKKELRVEVVTGELTAGERREKVAALDTAAQRLMIATDCLSEGINLQGSFDAVVHYDLSWNPTRHEQREGRVDRFGQRSAKVRTTLMYGADNPVDGAVLEVIIRKAERIRKELGVPVPMPDSGHTLIRTLLKAILLRGAQAGGGAAQVGLFPALREVEEIDVKWTDAARKAKQNRTIFAQRTLKPADVLPEWQRTLAAVGGKAEVQRFVERALARLGSGVELQRRGCWKVPTAPLPLEVRERLELEGLEGTIQIDYEHPPRGQAQTIQRSHPLVSVLAEFLLERSLSGEDAAGAGVLGRVGCWITAGVKARTTVVLLRLRHQLIRQRARQERLLMVEEASAVAWAGAAEVAGEEALSLLLEPPAAEPPDAVRAREIARALELVAARAADLDGFAQARAAALLADHERVRGASRESGSYEVRALLPVDVIGVFVLMPKV